MRQTTPAFILVHPRVAFQDIEMAARQGQLGDDFGMPTQTAYHPLETKSRGVAT